MINDLVITKEHSEALELHNRILMNANMACASWVETCKCLKQMRDTKLYIELGYERFEDYTTQALNVKERQAYNYISAYENLGEQFLQSNATVGITKLALLAAVPVTERQEIVENNDLAGMTVDEVKKLVKENDQKGEQIGLLSDEIESLKESADSAEQRIRELEKDLDDALNKPVEIAVQEPDAETIKSIEDKANQAAMANAEKTIKAQKKELTDKFKADTEKAVAEAVKKANEQLEQYKQQLSEIDAEKVKALQKAQELEKKLAVSTSPETVKFTFYFDSLKEDYTKLFESIKKIKSENPEMADKYLAAMVKFNGIITAQLSEV